MTASSPSRPPGFQFMPRRGAQWVSAVRQSDEMKMQFTHTVDGIGPELIRGPQQRSALKARRTVGFWQPSRWPDAVTGIRSYSLAALAVAVACLSAATLLRFVVGWFGVSALYSTFFPAVLVTALGAGVPAAAALTVAAALIGSFLPPGFEFNHLTATDIGNIAIFVVSSGLIVFVAHRYRRALRQLRHKNSEHELLMREFAHRGRNTYAIVESIVRNTLGSDRDKADVIASRVRAVSSANDLVNWASTRTHTVPLRELLALVLGVNAERSSVSGPDVELSPGATRTLSLVFHELMTNAMKYGALSNANGTIAIRWSVDGNKVRTHWVETGGPLTSKPSRTGFGTTVITHSLASLSGGSEFAFASSGLRCAIEFDPTT
jgi:two-component sensor histidine kinase